MNHVDYTLNLSGSKLFDVVVYNTAKKLCMDYPGLNLDVQKDKITVSGDLDDYWYEKYQEEMFGTEEKEG